MQFITPFLVYLLLGLCVTFSQTTIAQENEKEMPQTEASEEQDLYVPDKGFHLGVIIGAYWANRNTAYLYDGYGYDIYGQRNSFVNSVLRDQVVNVYGGGNGGVDYIAQLLNVNPGDWTFTESDMPVNLRYTTTYIVGLNTRYRIDKKSAILLNINGTKLNVNGKFTITALNTTGAGNGLGNGFNNTPRINQFAIVGSEQRLMFQFGYQRLLGKNKRLNFLVEAGMNIIMSKAQKNQAVFTSDFNGGANNFTIDLMNVYRQSQYYYYSVKYFTGVGIGAFAGLGINFNINPKYSIQLLYNPSYDRITLGYAPTFKLQNACGFRVYYNLSY